VKTPLVIWIVTDGKPGHENQSLGLADALGRRAAVALHRIELPGKSRLFGRLRQAFQLARALPPPDLILGAGHATHLALIGLARHTGAPCVVMMKPSLPCGLFDLCLVPAHDLQGGPPSDNIVPTVGALNRVIPGASYDKTGHLILLGGPSSSHGWDADGMLAALKGVLFTSSSQSWELTDSRRTPAGMRESIQERLPGLVLFPHEETGPGWVPGRLAAASEVWVTEDSVSMIYEALSSGAAVGLLPVPRRKSKARSRVARGIDRLVDEGLVTRYGSGTPTAPVRPLREADRCADLILGRWFPQSK